MAKKETPKAAVAAPKTVKPATQPTASVTRQVVDKAIAAAQVAQPHAEYIYVNAQGHYHLHPRPGFVKVDMSDGEIMVDKIRADRPIKLAATKPVAPVEQDADEDDDEDDVAPPADGKEF